MGANRWRVTLALAMFLAAGCTFPPMKRMSNATIDRGPPTATAERVVAPPTLGGAAWERSPAYPLTLNAQQIAEGEALQYGGTAQFAWDDAALYLRVEMDDADPFTTATADGDVLYQAGDVAEWFVGKPPPEDWSGAGPGPGWYLELHVAPNGLRSGYRITAPGRVEPLREMPFEAEVQRTEAGWAAWFTLPWSALREMDPTFEQGDALSVLVGRYNYPPPAGGEGEVEGKDLVPRELSMWPTQPETRFHLRPYHAPLRLEP